MKKILRALFLSLAGASLIACSLSSQASARNESYIALEVNSGRVLYSHNAEKPRPVAALSQVATAIVTLDWLALTKVDMNRVITVPASVGRLPGANPMHLAPGDSLTLRDALYSTLLGSDTASALTIAEFVGRDLAMRRGSSNPEKEFVKEMNSLAEALGMTNTDFRTPHGLDSGKVTESTAADMALLGVYAMRNDAFTFIVSQSSRRIGVRTSGGTKFYDVKNSNALLRDPGVDGIKTGNSGPAGPCAMIGVKRASVRRYDKIAGREALYPQRMVVVVLGSDDRYPLCRELIREGWRAFDAWLNNGLPREEEQRFLYLKGANG